MTTTEPAADAAIDEGTDAPPDVVPDPAALIFDLDGTLVDTVEARIESWLRTFAEIGFPTDREHVSGLIGSDGKRLAREVAEVGGRRLSDDRAEAVDRRAGEIFDELNRYPRPHLGATDLLSALDDARLPWSIATSSRAEQVTTSVASLGLGRPPRITDSSNVEHAKPAPDLLLHAADQLDLPAQVCWYVGDSTWDMRAARAAGMVAVGVTLGAVDADALGRAGARLPFDTLVDLHRELWRRGVVRAPRITQ